MEDSDSILVRFNRLMRELENGRLARNCFRPWEIELLLDFEACDLGALNKSRLLARYRKAVQRQIGNGATRPLKLSEYLARLGGSKPSSGAPESCYPEELGGESMGCGSVPPMAPLEQEKPGARKVFCVKFQREMPGLDEVPFEGHPLGQRIYENVSKEAWKLWVEHMKMIINEYRLNPGTAEAQEFLLRQMEEYFFGQGAAFPPGYVPPRSKA